MEICIFATWFINNVKRGCYVMYGIDSTLNDMGNMGGPKPTLFCWLYINLYEYE